VCVYCVTCEVQLVHVILRCGCGSFMLWDEQTGWPFSHFAVGSQQSTTRVHGQTFCVDRQLNNDSSRILFCCNQNHRRVLKSNPCKDTFEKQELDAKYIFGIEGEFNKNTRPCYHLSACNQFIHIIYIFCTAGRLEIMPGNTGTISCCVFFGVLWCCINSLKSFRHVFLSEIQVKLQWHSSTKLWMWIKAGTVAGQNERGLRQ